MPSLAREAGSHGVPVRRVGHDFSSMVCEMAGRQSFRLRRNPRRSKILAGYQGTGELLGGRASGDNVGSRCREWPLGGYVQK